MYEYMSYSCGTAPELIVHDYFLPPRHDDHDFLTSVPLFDFQCDLMVNEFLKGVKVKVLVLSN